jgi:hypothetical protein
MIYCESDNEGSSSSSVERPKKRIKITIELEDSDDEWDEWLSENILERLGLRPRSMWMHPLNLERFKNSEYVRICVPLRKYPEKFRSYFRMSVSTFDYIHDTIKDDITKYSNRPSIPPAERLAVTLR